MLPQWRTKDVLSRCVRTWIKSLFKRTGLRKTPNENVGCVQLALPDLPVPRSDPPSPSTMPNGCIGINQYLRCQRACLRHHAIRSGCPADDDLRQEQNRLAQTQVIAFMRPRVDSVIDVSHNAAQSLKIVALSLASHLWCLRSLPEPQFRIVSSGGRIASPSDCTVIGTAIPVRWQGR